MVQPPEFVLYLRKSKGRAGIARQRRDCQRHAEKIGARIVAEFVDSDTTAYARPGERARRDDYARMLDTLRADGRDVPLGVMAWHTDRLNRSPADAEDFIAIAAAGGHLVETARAGSYDLSTPTGRKRFRQDAVDAAFEVDHMTERIESAKDEAAAEGRWLGGRRPFGYEGDGHTLRLAEAHAIDAAASDVLSGVPMMQIMRDWAVAGLTSTSGHALDALSIRRILLRPRNAGVMVHRGKEVGRAVWLPALCSREYAPHGEAIPAEVEERWRADAEVRLRAVQAVLLDPSRRTSPGNARRWLGSGLYVCGFDGCRLALKAGTAGKGAGERRGTRPAYRCQGTARHVVRDAVELDRYVTEAVVARLERPDAVALLPRETGEDAGRLRVELLTLRRRLDELAGLYAEGDITAAQLREGTGKLRTRIEEAEGRLAATVQVSALDGLAGMPDAGERWEALSLERRRAVLSALVTVTVLPAPRGRPKGWRPGEPYFHAEAVRLDWREG